MLFDIFLFNHMVSDIVLHYKLSLQRHTSDNQDALQMLSGGGFTLLYAASWMFDYTCLLQMYLKKEFFCNTVLKWPNQLTTAFWLTSWSGDHYRIPHKKIMM